MTAMTDLTQNEPVHRFRVVKHIDLPEGHKAAMRESGIDPDSHWTLYASFASADAAEAERQAAQDEHNEIMAELGHEPHTTYRVVDGGEATTIERPVY